MSRRVLVAAAAAGVTMAGGAILFGFGGNEGNSVASGRALYAQYCASCHGANLEGQTDWRRRKPDGRLPAPPHNASGHTWHHPDDVLFKITKLGTEAVVGGGYKSDMPGFGATLDDDQIRAVLAYIKSTWPENIRQRQESMNARQNGARR